MTTRASGNGYWEQSSSIAFGIVASLPLFALYEIGIRRWSPGIRNGAEYYLKHILHLATPAWADRLLWAAVAAATLTAAIDLSLKRVSILRLYPRMVLEGLVWGVLLGPLVIALQSLMRVSEIVDLSMPVASLSFEFAGINAVLAIGAGLYEEILFRLLLLSALFVGIQRTMYHLLADVRLETVDSVARVIAIVVSSIVFSYFHYVGHGAPPLEFSSFVFRLLGGVLLGTLFMVRGLGVVVYTHAFYDLLVIFVYQEA